jgi:ABC-type branched-subunit amino acid transport system ATPase component
MELRGHDNPAAAGQRATSVAGPAAAALPSGQDQPLLAIAGVSKRFGGIVALDGISFEVERGQICGLIGPNGSGKTTLFNCITGIESIQGGQIFYKGRRIDGLKPYQVARRGIGRTFQIIRVFPQMTALENLLAVTDGPIEAARSRAEELLAFVTLTRLKEEYAGNLSYGQQKLLEFIRVLMTDPELILLDEPAAGVNRTLLNDLISAMTRLRDAGKTILIVEHDMKVVMGLCETVYVLDYGVKIAEGPPSVIQSNERVIEAYFGH